MVVRFIASSRGSKSKPHRSQDNKSRSNIVQRTKYDGFTIEVSKKSVGMTMRRDVFDAMIRREVTGQVQVVSNHPTIQSAVQAAKQIIDNQRRKEMPMWKWKQRRRDLLDFEKSSYAK